MSGIEELVSAFAGGGRIENDSFSRSMQRLSSAGSAQAEMQKRIQEAYALSQQNKARDSFAANPFDLRDFEATGPTQQAALLGMTDGDVEGIVKALAGIQDVSGRTRLESARTAEGVTPANALANALQPTPKMIGNREEVGDAIVSNFYGAEPALDSQLTTINTTSKAKAGAPGVREQKIQDLLPQVGGDRNVASAIIDGLLSTRLDAQGNIVRVDERDGTADSVVLGAGKETPATPVPPPGGTMMELAEIGTGIIPVTSDVAARTLSLFGYDNANFESSEAIGKIKSMALQIINSQRQNPRFSEGERKDLLDRFSVDPGLLRSSGYLQSQLAALKETLQIKAAQAEADANNLTLTTTARGTARNSAQEARNAIALIGDTGSVSGQAPAVTMTPETRAAASAALADLPGIEELTPEEQERLYQGWIKRNGGQQ